MLPENASAPPRESRLACTVFAKSELAAVRLLHRSFGVHHPDVRMLALLADDAGGYFDPADEPFSVLPLQAVLTKAQADRMSILWDRESFQMLVRPYLLEHALTLSPRVLFLAPHTIVHGPLDRLFEALEAAPVGLVPKVGAGSWRAEAELASAVVLNMECLGVARSEEARAFLTRWKYFLKRGHALDTRFMNFLPASYPSIRMVGPPTLAWGAWSSDGPAAARDSKGRWQVEGEPLGAFHYGPIQAMGEPITPPRENLRSLYREYVDALLRADHAEVAEWPYAFDFDADGVLVPPPVRECMREEAAAYEASGSSDSRLDFVFKPDLARRGHGLPPIAQYFFRRRPDVQKAFGRLPESADAVLRWMDDYGAAEGGVSGLWRSHRSLPGSDIVSVLRALGASPEVSRACPGAFVTPEGSRSLESWVQLNGSRKLGLSPDLLGEVAATLRRPSRFAVHSYYQSRPDLQEQFPLGLTRVQSAALLDHLLNLGPSVTRVEGRWIEWFRQSVGKDTVRDVTQTWFRNRALRTQFPLGLTAFGSRAFTDHLSALAQRADPSVEWRKAFDLDLSLATEPLSQVRALWGDDATLRTRFPEAFSPTLRRDALAPLIRWLTDESPVKLSREWWRRFNSDPGLAHQASPGVTYVGLTDGHTGLSVAARNHARALAAHVPVTAFPIAVGQRSDEGDSELLRHAETPFPVNIVHCNDDIVIEALQQYGQRNLVGRTNIAYMVWESQQYTPRVDWRGLGFSEIWTPSSFSAASIAPQVTIPVQVMPHPVVVTADPPPMRAAMGIEPSAFVYLMVTDAKSGFGRKNPTGLVDAFRSAIGRGLGPGAVLVLKISDPDVENGRMHDLRARAEGLPVRFVNSALSAAELHGLIRDCDCYVSLHRAEGFGLTLAEAMAYGRPVVATGYSGNMDFMTLRNSYPVRYTQVEQVDDFYGKVTWAEPDVEHAAEQFIAVRMAPAEARDKGERAMAQIRAANSLEAIGARMRSRLELLRGLPSRPLSLSGQE